MLPTLIEIKLLPGVSEGFRVTVPDGMPQSDEPELTPLPVGTGSSGLMEGLCFGVGHLARLPFSL